MRPADKLPALLYSVYLLYSYKSTDSGAHADKLPALLGGEGVLGDVQLYLLYSYKSTDSGAHADKLPALLGGEGVLGRRAA